MKQIKNKIDEIFNAFLDDLITIEFDKRLSVRMYEDKEKNIQNTINVLKERDDFDDISAGASEIFTLSDPLTSKNTPISNSFRQRPLTEMSYSYSYVTKQFGFYSLLRLSESFDSFITDLFLFLFLNKSSYISSICPNLYKEVSNLFKKYPKRPFNNLLRKKGFSSKIYKNLLLECVKQQTNTFDYNLFFNYVFLIYFVREFRNKTAHNLLDTGFLKDCLAIARIKLNTIEKELSISCVKPTDIELFYENMAPTAFEAYHKSKMLRRTKLI